MSSMQLTPAVTARREQALQIAVAVAAALVASEIMTLHKFIGGWVRKGNIASWYYWTFQLVLMIVFASIAMRPRVTRQPALFIIVGAGAGYLVSFLLSLVSWFVSLGGLLQGVERLRPLGFSAAVDLSLWTPLILLSPVFGILPAACYLLLGKLRFFHLRPS